MTAEIGEFLGINRLGEKMKYFLGIFLLLLASCSQDSNNNEIVVYTSVDQVYSAKILQQFEEDTGILVKPVYDVEASKAVGLEQRLIAEKEQPRADVFWNSEFMRTGRLAQLGIFDEYKYDTSHYSSDSFFSKNGLWYGMGARTRVFIVNTEKLPPEDYPEKLEDLINPKYYGKIAMAIPYSGSTSTHFAALLKRLGKDRFIGFLQGIKANNVALLAGNSVVKDAVGSGKFSIGLVDTDDALVGIEQGLPLKIIYYNQGRDGCFAVYQTVSMVRGGPNSENAKKLANYLLTKEVEAQLIEMNGVQFPILDDNPDTLTPRMWTVGPGEIAAMLPESIALMREHLE